MAGVPALCSMSDGALRLAAAAPAEAFSSRLPLANARVHRDPAGQVTFNVVRLALAPRGFPPVLSRLQFLQPPVEWLGDGGQIDGRHI